MKLVSKRMWPGKYMVFLDGEEIGTIEDSENAGMYYEPSHRGKWWFSDSLGEGSGPMGKSDTKRELLEWMHTLPLEIRLAEDRYWQHVAYKPYPGASYEEWRERHKTLPRPLPKLEDWLEDHGFDPEDLP